MRYPWKVAVSVAAAVYALLFAIGLMAERSRPETGGFAVNYSNSEQGDVFAISRKNYASSKQQPMPAGQPIGNAQKYERVASLSQRTSNYDADKIKLDGVIMAHGGIVQLERGAGLAGRRVLYLGIGVPPEKYDAFLEAARAIGKTTLINTVKNDKTNEYLQLRAKRTTLEKSRAALEALQGAGGSIDERIHVQNRLAEIEEKIQELGVSLGDFDTQNELCTVRFTLEEAMPPVKASLARVIAAALGWATWMFLGLSVGLAAFMLAAWAALVVFGRLRQLIAERTN